MRIPSACERRLIRSNSPNLPWSGLTDSLSAVRPVTTRCADTVALFRGRRGRRRGRPAGGPALAARASVGLVFTSRPAPASDTVRGDPMTHQARRSNPSPGPAGDGEPHYGHDFPGRRVGFWTTTAVRIPQRH